MELVITLGDKAYTIPQPLNLGQLRDLSIAVTLPELPDPQEVVRRSYERAIAAIAAALIEDYPEMTAAAIYKIRGITNKQMRAAYDAILEFSGLIPATVPAEAVPGEAPGAA